MKLGDNTAMQVDAISTGSLGLDLALGASQINAGEDVLFVDEEALKTDPDALGGSSLADFHALYSSMKAEDTTEIKRHVQTVQEEWTSRGVTMQES